MNDKKLTLSDSDIKTVDLPRRKFLAKVGLRSAAVAAAAFTAHCSSSDRCDGDSRSDSDSGIFADPIGAGRRTDRCDSD